MSRASARLLALTAAIGCGSPPKPVPAVAIPPPVPIATFAPPSPEASAEPRFVNPPAGVSPSRIETRAFSSPALGVSKSYVAYLPRGYDDSTHHFPLVILLHGLAGSETNWTKEGHLREAADSAALAAIVVMPDGDDSFYVNGAAQNDYTACLKRKPPWNPSESPTTYCVRTPRYEDYIVVDLLADVESAYRTLRERRSRGIGGLSMGGFGALSLALRHQDLFSATASHSGMASLLYRRPHPYAKGSVVLADSVASWGGQYNAKFRDHVRSIFGPNLDDWPPHDPTELVKTLAPGALSIHIDCGSSDGFQFEDHAGYLHDLLNARGAPHQFALVPGGHTWEVWRATLPAGLKFFAAALAS